MGGPARRRNVNPHAPRTTHATPQKGLSRAHIYALVRRIPRGRVATYGQIAALAGLRGHARQVGYAMSALPYGTDVPWHRVINAEGRVSRRSDPWSEALQRQLLEAEGVTFDRGGRVPLSRYQWRPRRAPRRKRHLGLAAALVLSPATPGTLSEATIRIQVDDTGATVHAAYVIAQPAHEVVFNAIRLPERRLYLLDLPDGLPNLERRVYPGLLRLSVTPPKGDTLTVALTYRVEGRLDRIPLFVPETPTAPPGSRVTILVAGVPADGIAPTRFPRFERLADGTLRASPDHVPSLVAVVRADGGLALPVMVEVAVLVIVIAGSTTWLVQARLRGAWVRRS